MKTSDHLKAGSIYSRKRLREMFGITDATINTGVFHPKGHNSIWLFITEEKEPDRTRYYDELKGDLLEWDGQTMGRTDDKIITHANNGLELLVFYRKEKNEHPHSGFRYLGPFHYMLHSGAKPTHFILGKS